MSGSDLPITNMEHQYLVTDAIEAFRSRETEIPVMRDPYTAGYYRQEQKGGLIGIYEHRDAREAWGAAGGSPEWSSTNELSPATSTGCSPGSTASWSGCRSSPRSASSGW